MGFVLCQPQRKNRTLSNAVYVKFTEKNGNYKANFILAKDVHASFSDTNGKRMKILVDDQNPRKILLMPAKPEEQEISYSCIQPNNSKTYKMSLAWRGHISKVLEQKLKCDFSKYNHQGNVSLLVTLPE